MMRRSFVYSGVMAVASSITVSSRDRRVLLRQVADRDAALGGDLARHRRIPRRG